MEAASKGRKTAANKMIMQGEEPARCRRLRRLERMTSEDYVKAYEELQHFARKAHQKPRPRWLRPTCAS